MSNHICALIIPTRDGYQGSVIIKHFTQLHIIAAPFVYITHYGIMQIFKKNRAINHQLRLVLLLDALIKKGSCIMKQV